jgi:uncharacterized membrane protein YeaQ/YmgE (transglycosylase-associated protein family)
MGIVVLIIIGFIAGLLARAIVPGKQSMGLLATTLLGILGSFLGGWVSHLWRPASERGDWGSLQPGGIIISTLGAIVLLLLWVAFNRSRGGIGPRAAR